MNFLPVILFLLLAKNNRNSTEQNTQKIANLIKIASAVKESGIGNLMQQKNPMEAILNGGIDFEKLAPLFSSVMQMQEQTPASVPYEITGEEIGHSLERFLDETK